MATFARLVDEDAVAARVINPESPVNDAVISVANGVLGGGVAGLMRVVDARGNLSIARPAWSGIVEWWVNLGDGPPVHLLDGVDIVYPVATTELPWTPEYLSGKVAWFDARRSGVANGVAASQWDDLSGNGNHLVQATSGARPVMNTTKINGHQAFVADGVDDFMRCSIASPFTIPFTMYAVGGTDVGDIAATKAMLSGANAGSPSLGAITRSAAETYGVAAGSTALDATAGRFTVGNKLFKAVVNGASTTMDVNGTNVVSGSTGTSPGTMLNFAVFSRGDGTAQFWGGYLGEVLIVQGLVASGDHTKIYNYLNTGWGLGL